MSRPKSLGSYAKLSSSFYRDDAILEAGERAETLYVRGLAYCSESTSDGFISDRQLRAVIGVGMRDVTKRASALVSVGLWQREEGGYLVRSWLKWHKSADEINRYLKTDRERKARKADGIQSDSERNPVGIRLDSDAQGSKDAVQDKKSKPSAAPRRVSGAAHGEPPDGALDLGIPDPPPRELDPVQVLVGIYIDESTAQGGTVSKPRASAIGDRAKRLLASGLTVDVLRPAFEAAAKSGNLDFDRYLTAPATANGHAKPPPAQIARNRKTIDNPHVKFGMPGSDL